AFSSTDPIGKSTNVGSVLAANGLERSVDSVVSTGVVRAAGQWSYVHPDAPDRPDLASRSVRVAELRGGGVPHSSDPALPRRGRSGPREGRPFPSPAMTCGNGARIRDRSGRTSHRRTTASRRRPLLDRENMTTGHHCPRYVLS